MQKKAILHLSTRDIELVQKAGLWEVDIFFRGAKRETMLISAEDRYGNRISKKEIGSVETSKRGRVLSVDGGNAIGEAQITVFVFNEEIQSESRWQAEPYGFVNPVF